MWDGPLREPVEPRLRRHAFRSMGTDVTLIGPGAVAEGRFEDAAHHVESVFEELDGRFSRFRDDSELSRVNARAGGRLRVSPEFAILLRFALQGARQTNGLFDPTILPALVSAGYDRDFDELSTGDRPPARHEGPAGNWRGVRLDGTRLSLPSGTGLDFGGVAKGWAVDLAAELLDDFPWGVVNAGGDLRVVGRPPEGEVLVAVEDPEHPGREIARVVVDGGAVATSSVRRRAWGPGMHHLIDPRTWLPAATGVLQATAWAPTCAEAEIRSKWALLAGESSLEEITALLVMEDGRLPRSIPADEPVGEPA